jgi:transcriptional regulator with XRE-family HTH domain
MSTETVTDNQLTDVRPLVESLIDESLAVLKKDRDREVVIKRHGLKQHQPHTLEQIGSELGITRERVRQIEKAAFSRIREQAEHDHELHGAIVSQLDTAGGILQLARLLDTLSLTSDEEANLTYLVRVMPDIELIEHNDELHPVVTLIDPYSKDVVMTLHRDLQSAAKNYGKPLKFDKLVAVVDGPHSRVALEELAQASCDSPQRCRRFRHPHRPACSLDAISKEILGSPPRQALVQNFSLPPSKRDEDK